MRSQPRAPWSADRPLAAAVRRHVPRLHWAWLTGWAAAGASAVLVPLLVAPMLLSAPGPLLAVRPTAVLVHGTLTVSGTRFTPRSGGMLALDGATGGMPAFSVDDRGTFALTLALPSGTTPGAHTLAAIASSASGRSAAQTDDERLATASFTVVATVAELPSSASPSTTSTSTSRPTPALRRSSGLDPSIAPSTGPSSGPSTPGGATPGASPKPQPPASKPPAAPPPPPPPPPPAPVAGTQVYMHYYLWWTPRHWQEKLGAAYPYGAVPLPLPGRLDAGGCNPTPAYPGATIVDIPSEGLYDQNQAATFDRHIAAAASAGIRGFLASWQGTGVAGQGPGDSGYNARLDLLAARVNAYNAAHGTAFSLVLGLEAFQAYGRAPSAVVNDLEYFRARYAGNPAFRNPYSSLPAVMLLGSRQYPLATVQAASAAERNRLYLIGDETAWSWPRDAAYLDASSWYWSSQDPWKNPQSGSQVASLAAQLHAAGKRFFAPFTAGFNTQLIGGTSCIPRRGVQTLDAVWSLNAPSRPDGWFGISWNEIVENTYMEPSVAYGTMYLDEIRRLIGR